MKIPVKLKKEFNRIQDEIISNNTKRDKVSKVMNIDYFREVDYSISLGNVGRNLNSYFASLNDHPEIFISDKDVETLNSLVENPNNTNLRDNYFLKSDFYRSLNKIKPRFIRDVEERQKARNIKNKVHHIDLKCIYMMGDNGYNEYPENLDFCIRDSNYNISQIEHLKKSKNIFDKYSMTEMSNALIRKIKNLDNVSDYLGFKRMKPAEAAIAVAKSLQLQYTEFELINIPFNFFKEPFWVKEKPLDLKSILSYVDKKIIAVESNGFQYQPRLYPIGNMEICPKNVSNILNSLDNAEELNGCPMFDYYWVVVPSVNINHHFLRDNENWQLKINKEKQVFTNEYEACYALDKYLLENEYFIPVVLGERDGHCYFICLYQ